MRAARLIGTLVLLSSSSASTVQRRGPDAKVVRREVPAGGLNQLNEPVLTQPKPPASQVEVSVTPRAKLQKVIAAIESLASVTADQKRDAIEAVHLLQHKPIFTEADKTKLMNSLRLAEQHFTAEGAAKEDLAVSQSDLATIFQTNDAAGHLVPMEEARWQDAYQGDMLYSCDAQKQAFLEMEQKARDGQTPSYGIGTPWSGSNMKYCFAPSTKAEVRSAIGYGINQIKKAVPCIQFTDVGYGSGTNCASGPAVYITSENSGCWSYVGEISFWSSQGLNLQSPGCDSIGTAIHELLHALGVAHEQSRPDRETYVTVHYDRISSAGAGQFDIDQRADAARPYDILSVMHYSLTAFSSTGGNTIDVRDAGYALYTTNPSEFYRYPAGNRLGMTQLDADQMADFYRQVAGTCTSSQLTGSGSCTDTLVDGQAWSDIYGQGCSTYHSMQQNGQISDCSVYISGLYCCECGGGLRFQEWAATTSPSPAPTPTPPTPTPAPTPCLDDATYRDPQFGDSCSGWAIYVCNGFDFSAGLIAACPVSCGTCTGTPTPTPTPPPPPPPPPPTTTTITTTTRTTTTKTTTTPAPPPPPPPPPAPTCSDSTTYRDPYFNDNCNGWSNYVCSGFDFSSALEAACPNACRTGCPEVTSTTTTTTTRRGNPCQDSSSYRDPHWGDSCSAWNNYFCSGFSFTDELERNCPTACKTAGCS